MTSGTPERTSAAAVELTTQNPTTTTSQASMRGRKNNEKPSPSTSSNVLPPCRICGERGTGFHYGVNTCGACKGFFRRSLKRTEPYECIQSPLCRVGPAVNRRKCCPKCRYDKCVALGMCKEACKVGRYSKAKKSSDKKEAMEGRGSSSSSSSSRSSSPNGDVGDNNIMTNWGQQTPTAAFREAHNNSKTFLDSLMDKVVSQNTDDDNDDDDDGDDDNDIFPGFSTVDDGSTRTNDTDSTLLGAAAAQLKRERSPETDSTYTIINNAIMSSVETPSTSMFTHSTPISPTCYASNDYTPDSSLIHDEKVATKAWRHRFQTPKNNFDSSISMFSTANKTLNHDIPHSSHYTAHTPDGGKPRILDILNRPQTPLSTPLLSTQDRNTSLHTNMTSNHPMFTPDKLLPITGATSKQNDFKHQMYDMTSSKSLTPYTGGTAGKKSSTLHSSSSKRILEEGDEGSQPSTKRQIVLQTMEADSSRHFPPEKFDSLDPVVADDDNRKETRPLLFLVAPDPMKYVVSIFHQFPYNSFEKESIAPLLKLCYDSNTWIDDYLPPTLLHRMQIGGKEATPPRFPINPTPSSGHAQELPACVGDMEYDSKQMENLADHLLAVYSHYYGSESSFLSPRNKRKYLDMFHMICQLHDSLKGALNIVDDNTYYNILETTGLDVDKRKEYFDCLSSDFNEAFTRDVKYYRALPGFKELSLRDRINLTKSTYIFTKLFPIVRSLDGEKDVYIDEERGRALRMSLYVRVSNLTQLCQAFGEPYAQYHSLGLSFKELVILKAVFIICPDFCDDLEDPRLVTSLNNMYLKCLYHHMKTVHGPGASDERFNTVLRVLKTMKRSRDALFEARDSIKQSIRPLLTGLKQHSLIEEVFCE